MICDIGLNIPSQFFFFIFERYNHFFFFFLGFMGKNSQFGIFGFQKLYVLQFLLGIYIIFLFDLRILEKIFHLMLARNFIFNQ